MSSAEDRVSLPRAERVARGLTAAVVAGGVVEHALWVAERRGFPRDLNLAYAALPHAYDDVAHGAIRGLAGLLRQPGGWYDAIIAAWLYAVGPSGAVFNAVSVVWTALLLAAVAGLGRAWGGRWAGTAAAAVVAQVPFLSLSTRAGWVHAPEAALTAAGAWVLVGDPAMRRARTVAVLAVTGAAVIALRPSGLFWVAALGIAAAVGWRRCDAPRAGWRAAVGIIAAWGIAASVPAPMFGAYLGDKLGLRGRYGAAVASLPDQLAVQLQPVAGALVAVGLGLLAAHGLRTWEARRGHRTLAAVVIVPWLVAPPALYAVFHTGVDNFPLFHVALGLLAGIGWCAPLAWRSGPTARIAPAVAAVPALAWAFATGAAVRDDLRGHAPDAADRLRALLDATCPGRARGRTCVILSDSSLFYPQSEEPGTLELFLMDEPHVRLVHVHQRGMNQLPPAALATWTCGPDDARALERYPTLVADRAAIVARAGLRPAWHGPALPGEPAACTYWWLTPGGRLSRPEAVPAGGVIAGDARPEWMPKDP